MTTLATAAHAVEQAQRQLAAWREHLASLTPVMDSAGGEDMLQALDLAWAAMKYVELELHHELGGEIGPDVDAK